MSKNTLALGILLVCFLGFLLGVICGGVWRQESIENELMEGIWKFDFIPPKIMIEEKEVIKEIPVTTEIVCKNTTIHWIEKDIKVCQFPDEFRLRIDSTDFCKSIGYDNGNIHSWYEDFYVDEKGNTYTELEIECWKSLEEHTEKRYYYTMIVYVDWWYEYERMECEF